MSLKSVKVGRRKTPLTAFQNQTSEKQAQEGNSGVRLEMTNKRAKTCLNVKNVKKC